MTNYVFLKKASEFSDFADVAIAAEQVMPIDVAAGVFNFRRAI